MLKKETQIPILEDFFERFSIKKEESKKALKIKKIETKPDETGLANVEVETELFKTAKVKVIFYFWDKKIR